VKVSLSGSDILSKLTRSATVILDLSLDLAAALRSRGLGKSSVAELSPKPAHLEAQARENWLRWRKANNGQTAEETRRLARKEWLKFREVAGKGGAVAEFRAVVALEFQRLAGLRAANQERAEDWNLTSKALRDAIERFNRESTRGKEKILNSIMTQSEMSKAMAEGIEERRDQIRDWGHGLKL
jgi:hypothetical protein